MFGDANAAHGMSDDALKLYKTDRVKYDETAREWTQKYAM